ncbi:uncharacterized protein LOC143276972 [Babylonia areolata]|uniref:uncharacterized protein LOC143276972 n=1 Tax=Babylonia areolata TaxID=304850 RepID=UPI003FD0AF16
MAATGGGGGGHPTAPQPTRGHEEETSPTDCPQCGSLCLGAAILPCGHISCRKCLHKALGPPTHAGCRRCGHRLELPRDQAQTLTVHQLVQEHLGTDPIFEQLVLKELSKDKDVRCLVCSNNLATNVCLDCQEYYCNSCSSVHRKMGAAKDHVVRMLPQALRNDPSSVVVAQSSQGGPLKPSSNLPTSSSDSIHHSAPCSDSIHNSAISSDSIRHSAPCSDSIHNSAISSDSIRHSAPCSDSIHNSAISSDSIRHSAPSSDSIHNSAMSMDTIHNSPMSSDIAHHLKHYLGSIHNPAMSMDDSIRNTGDSSSPQSGSAPSRGGKKSQKAAAEQFQSWVKEEVVLLQQASREQQKVEAVLREILSLERQLLNRVQDQQRTLDAYQHQLPRFEATQSSSSSSSSSADSSSSDVTLTSSDVTVDVRTAPLERRLCEVRQCRHVPKLGEVEEVMRELSRLLHLTDQQTTPDVTTPTSAHHHHHPPTTSPSLSPPTQPAISTPTLTPTPTPTFTPPVVDVMKATPELVFETSPRSPDDKRTPWITAVACLPDDRLVMADRGNDKVKVMGVAAPHTVSASLAVPERPSRLAVLSDGLVAMTTDKPVIYLMAVSSSDTSALTVRSRVRTPRQCWGIAGHSDGSHLLVVGCVRSDAGGPAAVHVLNRQGRVVSTLSTAGLVSPLYLSSSGGDNHHHVLVSDWRTDKVHQISLPSGQVTLTLQHAHVKGPAQACADAAAGSVYVASHVGKCVCVRSGGGQWRQLVTPSLHSSPLCVRPRGLCLTGSGLLVVAWEDGGGSGDSVVVGYKLS